ncbi:MAG: hypothetical protein ACO1O6_07320 [Bacteroidota bacterium]
MDKVKSIRTVKQLFTLACATILLVSCSEKSGEAAGDANDPFRKNLFNPFYLDQLFSTPNSSGSIWISSHLRLLDVDKVSVILKGGNNPDNVLEKFVYTFNSQGQNDTFQYYFFNTSSEVLNETYMTYGKQNLSKIDIIKYYGVGNLPPVKVYEDETKTVFYRSKSNGKNDSLFFYPNPAQPKVIIDKIGNFYNYIEIIVPKGSSATYIMDQVSAIDPNLSHFELSEKLLTYTEKAYPVESYHLGENWNQMELAKQWEYNKYHQPIHFSQWMHGTKIKDIDILYNENSLPKKITFNRKKYQLIYKKTT